MRLSREQAGVLGGMAMAVALTALLFAVVLPHSLAAAPTPTLAPIDQRLAQTLRWMLLVVACPLLMVARLATWRFLSPDAIGGSASDLPGSTAANVNAVLRNTVEQALLAFPVYLCLATLLPRPERLVASLAIAFAFGRALFWAGYGRGPAARALGFGLTFYPTVAGFLLAAWLSVTG